MSVGHCPTYNAPFLALFSYFFKKKTVRGAGVFLLFQPTLLRTQLGNLA